MRTYVDLVKEVAEHKENRDIPMSTQEHIYACKKELIFSSKNKIRIFTHDFSKDYHPFFYELSTRDTEIITIKNQTEELRNENLEYLLKSPNFKMFALDFSKVKREFQSRDELPSFMIVEPYRLYWEISPKDKKNEMVLGVLNFGCTDLQKYIDAFEKFKSISSLISIPKLAEIA